MTLLRLFSTRPVCRFLVPLGALLASCSNQLPVIEPSAPPPPRPQAAPAPQFAVLNPREPEAPPLAQLPAPARKVAVLVRETVNGHTTGEDSASESVVANALLAGRVVDPGDPNRTPIPRIEIVNRSVYEKAIGRDVKALLTRREDLGAEVLKNLAEVGCEILAMGEVTVASSDPAVVGKEVRDMSHLVQANVSLVRVDDAVTLGSGTATARRPVAVDAKRDALETATGEALRRFYEYRDAPASQVSLTVEGLRSEAEAAKVEKSLQGTKGVVWVKDVRFQLGPEGTPSSTARFDVGWSGKPDDLKQVLRDWDLGFRLAGTKLEGNRWTFRAQHNPVVEETK